MSSSPRNALFSPSWAPVAIIDPVPMSENDLDLDLDIDVSDDDEQATRMVPMPFAPEPEAAAPARPEGIFIFEPDGDQAWRALSGMGIHGQRASLGSDIMAAAQDGRLTGVIVAPGVDAELRELFVRALRGRFGGIPVVYLSDEAHDPQALAMMRAQGASAVFPWPPERAQLVPVIRQLMAGAPGGQALPEKGSAAASSELKLLTRKLGNVDKAELAARHQAMQSGAQPAAPTEVPRVVFEQAVREVAERSAENTSLRSELTIFRERTQMLEERLSRLTKDLSALTHERDELRARLVDLPTGPQLNLEVQERLESLKKIGDSVDSFLWGLEQAIQFLEELQFEAGDQRAPSLNAHLRSIKLVRVLLERLRERTRGM